MNEYQKEQRELLERAEQIRKEREAEETDGKQTEEEKAQAEAAKKAIANRNIQLNQKVESELQQTREQRAAEQAAEKAEQLASQEAAEKAEEAKIKAAEAAELVKKAEMAAKLAEIDQEIETAFTVENTAGLQIAQNKAKALKLANDQRKEELEQKLEKERQEKQSSNQKIVEDIYAKARVSDDARARAIEEKRQKEGPLRSTAGVPGQKPAMPPSLTEAEKRAIEEARAKKFFNDNKLPNKPKSSTAQVPVPIPSNPPLTKEQKEIKDKQDKIKKDFDSLPNSLLRRFMKAHTVPLRDFDQLLIRHGGDSIPTLTGIRNTISDKDGNLKPDFKETDSQKILDMLTTLKNYNEYHPKVYPKKGGAYTPVRDPEDLHNILEEQDAWNNANDAYNSLEPEYKKLLPPPDVAPISSLTIPFQNYLNEEGDPDALEEARDTLGMISPDEIEDFMINDNSEVTQRVTPMYTAALPKVKPEWIPIMIRADILQQLL